MAQELKKTRRNKVKYKNIELGFVFGDKVIVRKGINYGDLIIVNGHKNIVDGEIVVTTNAI